MGFNSFLTFIRNLYKVLLLDAKTQELLEKIAFTILQAKCKEEIKVINQQLIALVAQSVLKIDELNKKKVTLTLVKKQ